MEEKEKKPAPKENQKEEEHLSAAERIKAASQKTGMSGVFEANRKHPGRAIGLAIVFLAFIGVLILFAFARQVFGNEIGDMIFGEGVENGFVALWVRMIVHVPSLIVTIIIIISAIAIFFILNVIIRIAFHKNQKSQTIGSLVKSCIKYVTIIVAVAAILTAWGVDVASVIAGLGILTLIVGLGCQTLIQDVISGLFIVFDDYFSVGDLVIIDGFRGTVTSIGLKTTKVTDASGNIKSITNSSITTMVNVSRLPTMVTVSFDIGFNEDLERVEGIINDNLAAITKAIPDLKEGLYYKGVTDFTAAGVSLLFLGYCAEADRFQVVRDIKREVYLLCRNNNITVPFNQITVNPADKAGVKASEKQKAGADRLAELNHPKPVRIRKKKFREVAAEALKAQIENKD